MLSQGLNFKNWKQDVPAGIIVFLVAVPLCLGIALASDAPPFSGIIAGIMGGIVVTYFSGSALGVSGPAAGLAVIVADAILVLGDFRLFLVAVVLAGVIQLILGTIKAGIIAYYFPSSVIKGMLAAIGIILILKQIPHMVGHDEDYEGDLDFNQSDGYNTFTELLHLLDSFSMGAVIIGFVSLAILLLWETKFIKKHKIFQLIQGPLVAVAAGIGLKLLFDLSFEDLAISTEHLVQIPIAESFSELGTLLTFPDWSALGNFEIYKIAGTLAVVASIETLLSVEATDKLDPQKRITPSNKELRAQGIGNIAAGLVGGLPVTQVIVRSSTNINSGGKTKMASFLHGVVLLLAVLFAPSVLNHIPFACLAAVLLVIGYKLAKISLFKSMFARGWSEFLPFIITIVAIVLTDLLKGIGIGMVVAIFFILLNNFLLPFKVKKNKEGEKVTRIELAEDVSFLNKGRILNLLKSQQEGDHLCIDASKVKTIHPDVIEILEDYESTAALEGVEYSIIHKENLHRSKT